MSGQITVLHVDDEPDFTEMAAEFLTREDDRIEVVTAADARDGLTMLEAEPVDCVVSDYDMPGMDGLAFLERVRERNDTIPFVLFTGKGSEAVASRAFSAGATDYLQKTTGTDQYAIMANRVTKYVERARAQRERDRRLEAIETASEGISILDEDGRFVYVNEAYADIYGYDPEAMVGEHWELIYDADEARAVRDEVLPVVEETGEWEGETIGLRADGTTFIEDHTVSKTADGGFVCTVVDVTDRKRRVEEYDRYRTLVEALDDPVYVLDAEGRFQYVNRAFVDLVGYEYERILGSTPELIKDAAAVERAEDELGTLLSDDGPDSTTFEVEIHPRDDDPVLCEDHMGVLPYEGERFRGSVGTLRDVTRAKRVRRERRLLEAGIGALEDVFFIFDDDGEIRWWNDRIPEVTGYADAEIEGMTLAEFIAEEHRPRIRNGLEEMVETGTMAVRADYLTKDGDRIPYEFKATQLTDDDGGTIGFVGIGRDVTDQLEHEERLERKNERLEEFASIVSHDLRNPLNVAQGRLDLALRERGRAGDADGERGDDEHLAEVADALDRMERMIAELLTLAKEGDPAIDRRPVRLGSIVDACWNRMDADGASVHLEEERTIHADEERVQRLFANLFQNAIDHGGPDVTIRVGPLGTDGGDGGESGFYVADDGPGIPETERNDVFDDGYTTREEGVGFGLSIVQRIAEAHGWDVRVTEGRDGGARFEITGIETGVDGPTVG